MFDLRDFIKKGLLDAVGKMPDYRVMLNAVAWYDKQVLLDEDMQDISSAIDEKNRADIGAEVGGEE